MQLFFHVLFKATFRDDPTKPANKNYNPSKISKIRLTELQTTVKHLARSELFQNIITFTEKPLKHQATSSTNVAIPLGLSHHNEI